MENQAYLYGGPSPTFVRLHAILGILVFIGYVLQPSFVVSFLLQGDVPQSRYMDMFTLLYGSLGVFICVQLFLEPVLSRRESLCHGFLGCIESFIILRNKDLITDLCLYLSIYFIFVGIYFIIRAPNAICIPASKEDIKKAQASPKLL